MIQWIYEVPDETTGEFTYYMHPMRTSKLGGYNMRIGAKSSRVWKQTNDEIRYVRHPSRHTSATVEVDVDEFINIKMMATMI